MSNEVLEGELNAMSKALEEPVGTEEPNEPPPEPPKEPPKEPPAEPPKEEPPKEPAPPVPPEDPRDVEIRKLRSDVEELRKPKAPPEPPLPPPKKPDEDLPIAEEDFLKDFLKPGEELEDFLKDPKSFNTLMNRVYKRSREEARADMRRGHEGVLRSIPDIVKNNVALNSTLASVSKKFYEDNKDLIPWAKAVALTFEELIAKNPGKKYDEILPDVATEVRKRLNLKKEATDNNPPPPPPKKKGGGPRQPTPPDTNQLQEDMDKMDKALGLTN